MPFFGASRSELAKLGAPVSAVDEDTPLALVPFAAGHNGLRWDAPEAESTTVHLQRVDVNLGLIHITRAFVGAFGLMAVLGCIASDQGARIRLQCALAAASCTITTALYVAIVDIRRASHGYGHAANARVDSLRYATWTVTHALLAWLALSVRGPFEEDSQGDEATFMGEDAHGWKWRVVFITSGSMIAGGIGVFGVQTARRSARLWHRVAWFLLGVCAILASITGTTIVGQAIHMPADTAARSASEIDVGLTMSRVWVAYPLTSLVKFVVALWTSSPVTDTLEQRWHPLFHPLAVAGADAREALIWTLRALSSARDYDPLARSAARDPAYADTFPVLYTQIFEALLALLDAVAIGLPALAMTVFAFPV
jgi:hypothetical protein